MPRRIPVLFLLTAAASAPAAAMPDPRDNPPGVFDPPLATQRHANPAVPAEPDRTVDCTWYPDLLIREIGVDNPGAAAVLLDPIKPGAPRPPCDSGVARAGELALDNHNLFFAARKGSYYVLEEGDGGVDIEPFVIIHAPNPHPIYKDETGGNGFTAAALDGPALRLSYDRPIVAPCSLPHDGPACWRRIHLPPALAAMPLPDCTAAYRAAKADPALQSVLTYRATILLQPDGHPKTLSRSALVCTPSD